MLDEFTELNGATVVVPRSHALWRAPDHSDDSADVAHSIASHVRVTGQPGDALLTRAALAPPGSDLLQSAFALGPQGLFEGTV